MNFFSKNCKKLEKFFQIAFSLWRGRIWKKLFWEVFFGVIQFVFVQNFRFHIRPLHVLLKKWQPINESWHTSELGIKVKLCPNFHFHLFNMIWEPLELEESKYSTESWLLNQLLLTMHYRLRSIKRGQFRFSNFASHFKQKSYFHFLIHQFLLEFL